MFHVVNLSDILVFILHYALLFQVSYQYYYVFTNLIFMESESINLYHVFELRVGNLKRWINLFCFKEMTLPSAFSNSRTRKTEISMVGALSKISHLLCINVNKYFECPSIIEVLCKSCIIYLGCFIIPWRRSRYERALLILTVPIKAGNITCNTIFIITT